jgi:hypothetical protein
MTRPVIALFSWPDGTTGFCGEVAGRVVRTLLLAGAQRFGGGICDDDLVVWQRNDAAPRAFWHIGFLTVFGRRTQAFGRAVGSEG